MFFRFPSRLSHILTEEQSLLSELWEYFGNKYFPSDLGEYSNFDIGGSSLVTFRVIVFGIFIGINLASLLAIFDKRVLGDFARTLISNDCLSPESAKTLAQLGYLKNLAVRSSLRSGYTLRRVVRCVEEEEHQQSTAQKRLEYDAAKSDDAEKKPKFKETSFKPDLSEAHFYIPEELKYVAEIKFNKKGTNWLTFLAVLVLSTAVVFLVFWLTPELLRMLDNFLTMVKGGIAA